MRLAACLVIFACLTGTGCKASVSAEMNASGEIDGEDESGNVEDVGANDYDQPVQQASEPAESGTPALLGARHELRLSPSANTPICTCLAVAVGPPNTPAFEWQTEPATIDPGSQLVIALSSEGIPCPDEPDDSLGASYWGYEQQGDDVIVIVENARFGRPITGGAIIPKPYGDGQVYIRPASKAVPYGRPLQAGQGLCAVGNPGERRAPPADSSSETLDTR